MSAEVKESPLEGIAEAAYSVLMEAVQGVHEQEDDDNPHGCCDVCQQAMQSHEFATDPGHHPGCWVPGALALLNRIDEWRRRPTEAEGRTAERRDAVAYLRRRVEVYRTMATANNAFWGPVVDKLAFEADEIEAGRHVGASNPSDTRGERR